MTFFKNATAPNHQPFHRPSRTSTEDPLLRHDTLKYQRISILIAIAINLVPFLSLRPVTLTKRQSKTRLSKTRLLLLNLDNLLFHLDSCLKTLMILGASWISGTRSRNRNHLLLFYLLNWSSTNSLPVSTWMIVHCQRKTLLIFPPCQL